MLPLNRAYNKRVIQDPHKNIPYMHYTALLLEKSIYVIIVYFLLQAHIKKSFCFSEFYSRCILRLGYKYITIYWL